MTISNSTFSGNTADLSGGIYNILGGTVNISSSTFSGNSATFGGGGIFNDDGMLTISNSTFSGNSSTGGPGGGIFNNVGTATLKNTIVANSASGGNCSGTITDGGNNLDSANACGFTVNAKINTNPNLGALTGSPAYFPLNPGSAAIDAGSNAVCAAAPVNNTSQNGVTRPVDGDGNGTATCDIGAYEAKVRPNLIPILEMLLLD